MLLLALLPAANCSPRRKAAQHFRLRAGRSEEFWGDLLRRASKAATLAVNSSICSSSNRIIACASAVCLAIRSWVTCSDIPKVSPKTPPRKDQFFTRGVNGYLGDRQ